MCALLVCEFQWRGEQPSLQVVRTVRYPFPRQPQASVLVASSSTAQIVGSAAR